MQTVLASEVRVGDQVAERDGYLLTVEEVVKQTAKTVTLRLGACMSSRQGMTVTVRKSARVDVNREEV